MEQARLNDLLEDPNRVMPDDIPTLQELVDKHPYFQSARLLLLKGLHQEGSVYFDEAARTCAAHVPDRKVIYELTVQKPLQEIVRQVESEMREEAVDQIEESVVDPAKEQDLEKLERMIVSEALDNTFSIEDLPPPAEQVVEETLQEDIITEEEENGEVERSFMEWITGEPDEPKPQPKTKLELIDSFLAKSPPEDTRVPFFSATDMGKLSLVEDMSFVTETLAKIYEKQGHIEKAIIAYEQLRLKEPQKSSYFAARLKELEEKRLKK